jgi:hypothetical protein
MSTGASYFIKKYKLAREQLAISEGCSCTVKDQEKYMTAPYKNEFAMEKAKFDLAGLRDVLREDVNRFEGLLKSKRQELKKNTQQEVVVQNAAKNRINSSSQQAAKVSNSNFLSPIALHPSQPTGAGLVSPPPTPPLSNSSPGSSGQSQTGSKYPPGLGARIHLKLKDSERVLTPIWLRSDPSFAVQQPNSNLATPVKQQNIRKRKYDGLFDLESTAKRPHLGYCTHHVFGIKKLFIADKYAYMEKEPAASQNKAYIYTKHRVESFTSGADPAKTPVEGATTRKRAANGAKLIEPKGDTGNFSREGGLVKVPAIMVTVLAQRHPQNGLKSLPRNEGTKAFKLTKAEVNNDYKEITNIKKIEAMKEAIFKPLREELFALARRYESIEYTPSEIYNNRTAKLGEKNYKLEKDSREGEKCAYLAKNVVEAKEKLVDITKRLETINKKLRTDPSTIPRLSAIPMHIRILSAFNLHNGKPARESGIKTNAHLQRVPQLRKPSNLRYELSACLAEKAAAQTAAHVAAEMPRVAKEQEEREVEQRQQEAIEAMIERQRRKRAEVEEGRRRYALNQAKETMETGVLPVFQDEKDKQEFNWVLNSYRQSEEGMRAQARLKEQRRNHAREQVREALENGSQVPSFRDEIEQWYFWMVAFESKLFEQESKSEGSVQGDQDEMEGVESDIRGMIHGEGGEREGVDCPASMT